MSHRLWVGAFLVFCGLAAVPAPVIAADESSERAPAMRERAFKQLNKARELAEAGRLDEALAELTELRDSRRSNSYERAMAWNLTAFVEYERDNEQAAASAYQNVLAEEGIPSSLRQHTLYALAQMQMSLSQWQAAAKSMESWFGVTDAPTTNAFLLLGSAYFQLEDYPRARKPIERAIAQALANDEVPKENAYLLLRSIYYAEKDYKKMIGVLKSLCQHYSKREYWVQLAAVYGEQDQSQQQLATMLAAHDLGLLETSSDYLILSQLLLGVDVPYRAAKVLSEGVEKGIVERNARSLRLLADAWVLSKEYGEAIVALRSAATLTGDAELTLRLSQLLYEEGSYEEAVKAANQALAAGKLKNGDQAHVIKGLALFELENLPDAQAAFREAAKFDDSRQMARQWLAYIDNEQERRKALQEIRERGASRRASAS